MAVTRARIAIGDVLAGHYVIEAVLDEGGMAIVFAARNTGTAKACAIKVLHAQLGNQPDIVKLFAKEARVGAVIGDSDFIVEVYDAGIDEGTGAPFIVMELLDGETLERALDAGPLPRDAARIILRQLGEALDQAHAAGVVHRDLKPSNLFVTRDGHDNPVIKVMDFGIAKVLEEGAVRTATQIGTPAYTAPEQMGATTRKLAAKQGITISKGISPATDVWALGLIAYELFTGQRPGHYWGIETVNELPMKVAFEELEAASKRAGDKSELLPPGFDGWFSRCMRKNAKERWQSAGEAIRQLLALEQGIIAADEAELVEPGKSRKDLTEAELPKDTTLIPTPRPSRPSLPPGARTPGSLADQLPMLPRTPAPLMTIPAAPTIYDDHEAKVEAKEQDEKKANTAQRLFVAALASDAVSDGDEPPRADKTSPKSRKEASPEAHAGRGSNRLLGFAFAALVLAAATAAWWLVPGGDSAAQCLTPRSGMDSAQVAKRCESSCGAGSLASCEKLASMHARGDGVAKDEPRARQLLARACGISGMVNRTDPGAQRWIDEVTQAGCEQPGCVARACAALGDYHQTGRAGVNKDPELAAALYKRACQVDYGPDSRPRGLDGCVGLGAQREHAGQGDAARAYYRAACDGGVVSGCVALASQLETATDPKLRDDKQARALYQRACDASAAGTLTFVASLEGCARLGTMVERGRGGWVRDDKQAVSLYQKACDGGALSGCVSLANAHGSGKGGITRDAVKAAELLKRACDGGEQDGCAQLAQMIGLGEAGITQDGKRAFLLNHDACDAGSLVGCANLGRMYLEGQAGLAKDEAEARKLFSRACDGGEAAGCLRLATLEADKAEPLTAPIEALLAKACDTGAPDGCVKLGTLLEEGLGGFPKDLTRAADLYRRGCDDGSMRGCTNLANLAYLGEGGLERDAQRSVQLNDKACTGGDPVGCARLGVLYALGQGVDRNPTRANELFKGACTAASDENKNRCTMLQKLLLTPNASAG